MCKIGERSRRMEKRVKSTGQANEKVGRCVSVGVDHGHLPLHTCTCICTHLSLHSALARKAEEQRGGSH